jgi:formate-dependent nitrite reductase membrane component NrfD
LLALPVGVSLTVFAGLIAGGFLLGKLLNWNSLPVRFIWIALSAGAGLRLFDRMRKSDPDDEEPTTEGKIES